MRHLQRDGGERPGQTSVEKARIKELEREERELRQGEEVNHPPWSTSPISKPISRCRQ
jgi:hypothetical protein